MLSAISYSPLVKIDLGPLSVSPHGIFTAVGFLVGAWFFLRDTRRRGIDDEPVIEVLMRAAIGAIVGARLVYVVNHLDRYASPVEWLKVWEGGISLLGGLTGGVLVGWWAGRRRGLDVVGLLDLACPWFPLGIAVGRIGDVIIADHLGPTTSMPFGFECPSNPDVGVTVGSPCPPGEVVHLTAAYDMLAAAAIFVVMYLLRRRLSERRGQAALALVALYGLNRFTLDFVRADDRRLGLTGSQWTALVAFTVATTVLVIRWKRPPEDLSPPDSVDQADDIARRP
ncbi:prolipoprotein diacylglyceryl transferase [Iamia sp. SCSIO 61187]|uniref:prolipoprotein diacylglyceryl transferase n=1 Tax=Iamia sp. SCSIO 61187 TaxID=2722752 RepID=UPI001C63A0DA|nr:prolipoprotein diacylglyceryl transferase family protein [Iamia sp. SCSIO 61187]QYG94255.1 prolipoprotein diacylglyceryl transferase [Iamia sp. SCSIO 61187]